MERLTTRREDGTATGIKRDTGDYVGIPEMLDRLADYEDTGLAPEEVAELDISDTSKEQSSKEYYSRAREAERELAEYKKALELACELVQGNGCPMIRDLYRRPAESKPYTNAECDTCMEKYHNNPPISKCYVDYFLRLAKEAANEAAKEPGGED